jgi:glycosyltransferase involved in cell wall biosynthesis
MKILHVIASMDPLTGGPCQGIRNSNNELTKLGVDREVVSLDDPGAPFLGKDLFPVYALGPGKTRWCYNPKLFKWLLHNIPRFDVVIVNGLWLYHGYAVHKAMRVLQKRKKASSSAMIALPECYIMTHGMLDPYFQRAASRRLKAVRNWFYWKLIESKVVNGADGLLFTCETELLLARQPFRPYHPKNELNVGYGLASPPAYNTTMRSAFQDRCPSIQKKQYLLFLSRIHEKKGIDILIKTYANIIKSNAGAAMAIPCLVIAGPGIDTAYGKKIRQLAECVKDFVFFPGMLTGDAKWGAFYGCNAFVLPSHQENFGIAVVEALACSKPVLISNQVNIWYEVKEAGGGIIADDTAVGTKHLLQTWLGMNEHDKVLMAGAARGCFEKNFDITRVSKRFLDAVTPHKNAAIEQDAIAEIN